MQADDTTFRRARLNAHGYAHSGRGRLDSKRAQTPNTLCNTQSSRRATIGDTSIGPNGGRMRRNGFSIHSVRTYVHRIHFEYGEIWNHVEITRTSSAMRRSAMVHATSSLAKAPGLSRPTASPPSTPYSARNTQITSNPPTTMTTSVHQGALLGCPPLRTIRRSMGV